MRALTVAIVCGALGCRKPPATDERPNIVEITLAIDGDARGDVAVATDPPHERQMIERNGIRLAIAGIPSEGDATTLLRREIWDAEHAGSNATVLVTKRCLRDLVPALERDLLGFWTVAVVVGARCDGGANPRLGAMLLVEADKPSRVKITFERATRAFVKIEPVP